MLDSVIFTAAPLVAVGGTAAVLSLLRVRNGGSPHTFWTTFAAHLAVLFGLGLVANLALKVALAMLGRRCGFPRPAHLLRPSPCPGGDCTAQRQDCRQCGLWTRRGGPLQGRARLGMPSGHAQVVLLCGTMLLAEVSGSPLLYLIALVMLTLVAASVLWHRAATQCHTPLQITAGALIGTLCAPLATFLLQR